MGRKDERKRRKKRDKERRKAQKYAARNAYPAIVFVRDGEDDEFMSEVERIASEFDFDSPDCCDEDKRQTYKAYRKVGFEGFEAHVASPESQRWKREHGLTDDELLVSVMSPLLFHFGEWIFNRLPEKFRANPLPFYYYHIAPLDRKLRITFAFLPRTPSEHGTIYSSPLEPTVRLGGGIFKVGFFRHPLEQACKRMAAKVPITYTGFVGCFRYFQNCVYYEPVTLLDGEPGIRLYTPIRGRRLSELYLQDIAGLDTALAETGKYHYVVGYCPLAIVRRHAVAKTFLYPGYRNTPEADLFDTVRMGRGERAELVALSKNSRFEQLIATGNTAALKFFHVNGVHQVVELEKPVCQYSWPAHLKRGHIRSANPAP